MFDSIDKVVFINLDERTDRRKEIEEELLKVFPPEKIERFAAIKLPNGAVGCSMSHLAVIKRATAEKWSNVMVVEDDFQWQNMEEGSACLETLMRKEFDVIMLGGSFASYDPATCKLKIARTTTGYIVKQHYYDRLASNYKEGIGQLIRTGVKPLFAIDVFWSPLQRADNWYLVRPMLCTQRPSYSDIENRFTDYRHVFK
jgi:glycosyl transferase family 25